MTSAKVCGNCLSGAKPCLGAPCALATTPTTDAREREAREDVRLYATCGCKAGPSCVGCIEADKRLDAYREAILATERARVRAVVEGMWIEHTHPCNEMAREVLAENPYDRERPCECDARAHNVAVDRILQRLDAEPTP